MAKPNTTRRIFLFFGACGYHLGQDYYILRSQYGGPKDTPQGLVEANQGRPLPLSHCHGCVHLPAFLYHIPRAPPPVWHRIHGKNGFHSRLKNRFEDRNRYSESLRSGVGEL